MILAIPDSENGVVRSVEQVVTVHVPSRPGPKVQTDRESADVAQNAPFGAINDMGSHHEVGEMNRIKTGSIANGAAINASSNSRRPDPPTTPKRRIRRRAIVATQRAIVITPIPSISTATADDRLAPDNAAVATMIAHKPNCARDVATTVPRTAAGT